MKHSLLLLFSLLYVADLTFAQQKDTLLKDYRSVKIEQGKKIILQSKIDNLADVIIKGKDNHYHLKKGTFIRSDSMDIEVNKNKQIIAIYANYDTTYNFLKGLYLKYIGEGSETFYKSAKENIRVTKWQDDLTIFELVEITENGKTRKYSIIFDKELYFKSKKFPIDLKNNKNSIELLKRIALL
jgi:hypothetical protein